MSTDLPTSLTRNLPDSVIQVVSWSASSGVLSLRVEKDIGPEIGQLQFHGVAVVHLPPRFTVAGLRASRGPVAELPGVAPDSGEHLFVFEEAWGTTYYVVAESLQYEEVA